MYIIPILLTPKKIKRNLNYIFSVAMFLEKILKYKLFFSDKLKDLFDKLQQQKPLEMKWVFFSKFQYTTISFEFFDSIFG